MSKRIYTEILRGSFKSLGHFADEAIESKFDFDFFYISQKYIIQLFRTSKALEVFYVRWAKEKSRHLKNKSELGVRAPSEIKEAFLSLKLSLEKNHLLKSPDIKAGLDFIESVFKEKSRYRVPTYLEVSYERITSFLKNLLREGHEDIVANYATIKIRNSIRWNVKNQKNESIKEKYIQEFIFAPSLTKLCESDDLFCWDNIQSSWVAWEYLCLLDWCWNTPFSFFHDKSLNWEDHESFSENGRLLVLHSKWIEVDKIKRKDNSDRSSSFFTRERFTRFLKLIINDVILEQEKEVSEALKDAGKDDFLNPFSIEIKMDFYRLCLEVCWVEGIDPVFYRIHRFHEKSGPYKVAIKIFESDDGGVIDVEKVSDVSNLTATKFFDRLKLNKFFRSLFFEKLENQNTNKLKIKRKKIICQDLSKENKTALLAYIKPLREHIPSECSFIP